MTAPPSAGYSSASRSRYRAAGAEARALSSVQASPSVDRRAVLSLVLPAMGSALLQHAFRPIDQYFVKVLGQEAQGAVAATNLVSLLLFSSFLLVAAGAAPLVARATGAADPVQRREVMGAALWSASMLAIALFLFGLLGVDAAVGALGLGGETGVHAAAYLRALALCGALWVFAPTVDGCFQAMGDTRLPMLLQGVALVINLVLTPLLIAQVGVAGAALGTVAGQSVGASVGLYLLVRRVGLRAADVRPGPWVGRIFGVGAPVALSTAAYALVYVILIRTTVAPLGPAVLAGLGIGFGALESITWPLFLGWSIAVSSLVGRLLGAGREDLAWRAIAVILPPALLTGLVCGLVFRFAGEWIVGPFAADADAFREGLRYAHILALTQPLVAMEALGEGVLAGAGDTRRLFWATVPFNVLRIPLAFVLAFPLGMGPDGLWWAINVSTVLKASLKMALVWQGGWARALVPATVRA